MVLLNAKQYMSKRQVLSPSQLSSRVRHNSDPYGKSAIVNCRFAVHYKKVTAVKLVSGYATIVIVGEPEGLSVHPPQDSWGP